MVGNACTGQLCWADHVPVLAGSPARPCLAAGVALGLLASTPAVQCKHMRLWHVQQPNQSACGTACMSLAWKYTGLPAIEWLARNCCTVSTTCGLRARYKR